MRNITITVKEEVARWARISAAREDTSLSRMVGQILEERMLQKRGYQRAKRQYFSTSIASPKTAGGYPTRDQIHDREDLRRQ